MRFCEDLSLPRGKVPPCRGTSRCSGPSFCWSPRLSKTGKKPQAVEWQGHAGRAWCRVNFRGNRTVWEAVGEKHVASPFQADEAARRVVQKNAGVQTDGAEKDLRVALLTNSLSPHSLPVCEEISRHVKEFRAFVSADTDKYHNFPKAQASFSVTVQRSFNRFRFFRKAHGHWQQGDLHVPYDTFHKLQDYSPNLILSVQLGLRTALAAVYRRRHPHARLILWATLSRHTEEERSWLRGWLRRWIVRRIDGAFVNGKGGEEYLRMLGYTGEVYTVPYAIDDTPFRSDVYAPREGVLRLIYAGHLVPQKGVRSFCHVLNEWCVAHPEVAVHFAIAGEGPEERAIRTLPTEKNLSIALYRPMPQEQLATHYRQADIFVFPTLGDEWGVVVNEAMTAGLPVLGSIYSQAVLELVDEGVHGWHFDARDAESMYAGLDRAFACSVDRLYEISSNARERIAQVSPLAVAVNAVRAMEMIAAQEPAR